MLHPSEKPTQPIHWRFKLAAIEVGVIFDKNGLLYIFVGKTEGFSLFPRAEW